MKKTLKYIFTAIISMLFLACQNPNSVEAKDEIFTPEEISKLFTMVDIPSGSNITLGGGDWKNENPNHTVNVKAFKMSETLVTQKLFKAVMGFNPSHFNSNPLNGETQKLRPVDSVTWYTAVEFCNKLTTLLMGQEHCVYEIEVKQRLSAQEARYPYSAEGIINANVKIDPSKKGFRLSTHDEWEWAASGGEAYKYAGSDNLDEVGWSADTSEDVTHQVKKLKPNKFGLYDMTGNLWEWCGDLKDGSFEANNNKQTVQKGACALCPIDPNKDIYVIQAVQVDFFLMVSREKSGFRISCNAD